MAYRYEDAPDSMGAPTAFEPFLASRSAFAARLARSGPGHMRLDPHPDASAAVNALARFARAKGRRGYRDRGYCQLNQ